MDTLPFKADGKPMILIKHEQRFPGIRQKNGPLSRPTKLFDFYFFNAGWIQRSLFNSPVVTRD